MYMLRMNETNMDMVASHEAVVSDSKPALLDIDISNE